MIRAPSSDDHWGIRSFRNQISLAEPFLTMIVAWVSVLTEARCKIVWTCVIWGMRGHLPDSVLKYADYNIGRRWWGFNDLSILAALLYLICSVFFQRWTSFIFHMHFLALMIRAPSSDDYWGIRSFRNQISLAEPPSVILWWLNTPALNGFLNVCFGLWCLTIFSGLEYAMLAFDYPRLATIKACLSDF